MGTRLAFNFSHAIILADHTGTASRIPLTIQKLVYHTTLWSSFLCILYTNVAKRVKAARIRERLQVWTRDLASSFILHPLYVKSRASCLSLSFASRFPRVFLAQKHCIAWFSSIDCIRGGELRMRITNNGQTSDVRARNRVTNAEVHFQLLQEVKTAVALFAGRFAFHLWCRGNQSQSEYVSASRSLSSFVLNPRFALRLR